MEDYKMKIEENEMEDYKIKSKIENIIQTPRKIEEKNEGMWLLKASHELGHHVYEMEYEGSKKETTKIVTANAYDYRAINSRNFGEPWIEINEKNITFFSNNPKLELKLDNHIQYKVGKLLDLQNNRVNETLLRMFELIGMKDNIKEYIAKKPEAIIKSEEETIKDVEKWNTLVELAYGLHKSFSYEQLEKMGENNIKNEIEAIRNGWKNITNDQIEQLKQERSKAKEELESINAINNLTDEQWNRAVDLEDLIKQYTQQINEEIENEKNRREETKENTTQEPEVQAEEPIEQVIENLEQGVQENTTQEPEVQAEKPIEQVAEDLEQGAQENTTKEPEVQAEEPIEQVMEDLEQETEENTTNEPEIQVEEPIEDVIEDLEHETRDDSIDTKKVSEKLVKEEIKNSENIFLDARRYTEVPAATPIKKKWREIIVEKIKELAQKGKDAIENFFNR